MSTGKRFCHLGISLKISSYQKSGCCIHSHLQMSVFTSSWLWKQWPPNCCFSGQNKWSAATCDLSAWQCNLTHCRLQLCHWKLPDHPGKSFCCWCNVWEIADSTI